LLREKLGGDSRAAFRSAASQNSAAGGGFHPFAESGFVGVFDFGRLVSLFHVKSSEVNLRAV